MKRIDLTALVPDNTVDELNTEIKNIIENKYGGKVKGQNVSNTPPTGAGATLRDV